MRRLLPALIISLAAHLVLLNIPVSGFSGTAGRKLILGGLNVSIRERDTSATQAASTISAQTRPSAPDAAPSARVRPQGMAPPTRPNAGGVSNCSPLLAYHPPNRLTKKPKVVRDLASRDPQELYGRPESGRLVAQLCIEADGRVSQVNIAESDLPQVFGEVVARNFGDVLFTPGEIDGQPVRSTVRIEVRFAPPTGALAPAAIERVPLAEDTAVTPMPGAAEN